MHIKFIVPYTILFFFLFSYNQGIAQPGKIDLTFNGVGDGAESNVLCTALQNDGKIIIGGIFNWYDSIPIKKIVRLEANGHLDTIFNYTGIGADGPIEDMVIQPNGKIIIVGNFYTYNGVTCNRIARLETNGSLDTSFHMGYGATNAIHTVSLQTDGKIIIGGNFNMYDSILIKRLARLHPDGSLDISFNPLGSTDYFIYDCAIQNDGKIIIVGNFTKYDTTTANHVARIDSTGKLDTSFVLGFGANDNVWAVKIQPDNKILIAGEFTSYLGYARNRIARIHPNSGLIDHTFNNGGGADNMIRTIAIQPDSAIIIGGKFSTYNGVNRSQIARIKSNGSLDSTFDPGLGASHEVVCSVIQTDGKIILGGAFLEYDGTFINRIVRVQGNAPSGTSLSTVSNSKIYNYPNPFREATKFILPFQAKQCQVYTLYGQKIKSIPILDTTGFIIYRDNLPVGCYLYTILDEKNQSISGIFQIID